MEMPQAWTAHYRVHTKVGLLHTLIHSWFSSASLLV